LETIEEHEIHYLQRDHLSMAPSFRLEALLLLKVLTKKLRYQQEIPQARETHRLLHLHL
jgi:hypothetical protein